MIARCSSARDAFADLTQYVSRPERPAPRGQDVVTGKTPARVRALRGLSHERY
jgi:hypothetical protein